MSGSLQIPNMALPQITPIDVGGAMQRGQQQRINALALLAQQRQMDERQATQNALRTLAPALAGSDAGARQNALAQLLQAAPGQFQTVYPLIQNERDRAEVNAIFGGGGAAMPATPAAPAGPAPVPTVASSPLPAIAAAESGGNDNARNPRSSASGRYQIIDSTWARYAPRLGLTDAQRNDPEAQAKVAQAIQEDGAQALGRPLRGWEQYGAHLLGVGGMRAFANADPNANAREVYATAVGPEIANMAFSRNPGLLEPNMTVAQAQAAIARRVPGGGGGGAAPTAPAGAPATSGANIAGLTPPQMNALVRAAMAGNPVAAQRLQLLQPFLNRETQVERVRLPDGREMLVPRAQAVGMVSAPEQTDRQRDLARWRELRAKGDQATPAEVEERNILSQSLGGRGVNVNVDTRAETAEAQGRGTSLAQEGERVRVGAETAAATIDTIRQIRALGPNTDRLAPAREVLGGYLEALGISPANSRLVREATTLQAFNAAATNVILGRQMEQRGVQTDGDAQRMRETFATITNTNEANDLILRATEAQATRAMERADFYRDWRQQPGENGRPRSTLDGAAEAWTRYIRETPLVARLPDGRVVFFNEWLPAAMAGGPDRPPMSREEALTLWRQNASQRPQRSNGNG